MDEITLVFNPFVLHFCSYRDSCNDYCLLSFSKEREIFRDRNFFGELGGIQILFVLRFVESFLEDERKMN